MQLERQRPPNTVLEGAQVEILACFRGAGVLSFLMMIMMIGGVIN